MFRPKAPKVVRRYENKGGASNVLRYQLFKDGVIVEFSDNTAFRYTNQSAGPENIAKMKTLAEAGKGLGTFIKSSLKDKALRKIR